MRKLFFGALSFCALFLLLFLTRCDHEEVASEIKKNDVISSIPTLQDRFLPAIVSSFGSRFTLIPEPWRKQIRILPLGTFLPEIAGLSIRFESGDSLTSFPEIIDENTQYIQQDLNLGGTRYTVHDPVNSVDIEYRFQSLFKYSDPEARDIPAIELSISLINRSDSPVHGRLRIRLTDKISVSTSSTQTAVTLQGRLPFQLNQSETAGDQITDYIAPHLKSAVHSNSQNSNTFDGEGILALSGRASDNWICEPDSVNRSVSIEPKASNQVRLIILFHTSAPVSNVDGNPAVFSYLKRFPDVNSVVNYWLNNVEAEQIWRSVEEKLLWSDSSPSLKNLGSLALQTFLANSWLLRLPDGDIRYSEWEGSPRFHSTLDVAYNNSLFYMLFAPDLMENMLNHWPRYLTNGHMPHDFGKGLIIGATAYPVPMSIEEDCNYLLLWAMHRKLDDKPFEAEDELLGTVIQTALRIMRSDTDGNGLPDIGVINTFDDAPQIVNASRNQMYLGIKAAAALESVSIFLSGTKKNTDPQYKNILNEINHRVAAIVETVNSSFSDGHYPICLGNQKFKKRQVLLPYDAHAPKNTSIPNQAQLDNPDGYSIYVTSGLLPLLFNGEMRLVSKLPGIKNHMISSHQQSNTPFGDAHRDGSENVWISQNIWRDAIAYYLDVPLDFVKLTDQYWAFQMEAFRRKQTNAVWEGFCDSPDNSFLTAYSRGVSSVFLPSAKAQKTVTNFRH